GSRGPTTGPSAVRAGGRALGPPAARTLAASSASTQRPSRVTPTSTTSYRDGSTACSTCTALVHDTSCSAERPPKRTTSRTRSAVISALAHEQGPDAETHDEQA